MTKVLAIVCFLATVSSVSALTCYQCSAGNAPGASAACNDPLTPANAQILQSNNQTCQGSYCYKTTVGSQSLVRTCAQTNQFPGCITVPYSGGGLYWYCMCSSGNYCNAATSVIPKILTSTIITISACLLSRLLV